MQIPELVRPKKIPRFPDRHLGMQLPEKYKENFDVSSVGAPTCTV
jgi:hypothetical protein